MRRRAWNVLLGAAGVVVIVAGLRAAASVLIPVVIAGLLALVMLPVVTWLRDRGLPFGLAIVSALVVAVLVFAGSAGIVATAARRFVARVPEYRMAMSNLSATVSAGLEAQGMPGVTHVVDPGILLDWMAFVAGSTATLLSRIFLVLLIAAFILLEAPEFRPKLQAAFDLSEEDLNRLDAGVQHVHQFLWLKTLVSAATGALAGLWTALLGIDFALLWGLTAFLLNYIPNFGSLIAAVPPVLLALLGHGPGHALLVAGGYAVLNIALGGVLEPRLIGRRLGLSPLALVISLVLWGWMWGPIGLLLAVPLTMAIRLLLEEFEHARWLAVLIARAPTGRDKAAENQPTPAAHRTGRAAHRA